MKEQWLELKYVPLSQARRWDSNPKKHDLAALERSIRRHGFRNPPLFDATLGALVAGNGRSEVLERMMASDQDRPKGIGLADDGQWLVPVIFGLDAVSQAAATAFAVDANATVLLGAGLDLPGLLSIWDEEVLGQVLNEMPEAGALLESFNTADLDALLNGPDFEPMAAEEQPRLDRKKVISCPECGHEFRP